MPVRLTIVSVRVVPVCVPIEIRVLIAPPPIILLLPARCPVPVAVLLIALLQIVSVIPILVIVPNVPVSTVRPIILALDAIPIPVMAVVAILRSNGSDRRQHGARKK